uniref:Uncharacterized protein n=1 Tax=Oryza meridionalis TaxID=40149 RepID=A0A0E0EV11_9ORYZ
MDAGDEGFPPPADTSRSSDPTLSAAPCSGSIPAAGEARHLRDIPPVDSRPVAWFFFADVIQAQLPALLAVATSIALDDTRPDGFVIAGHEGDAFAVPVRRDAVLGSIPGGEARGISWRAVVCTTTTTSRGQDDDAAGRALSLPAGPYVVLTKRARGSWPALLRTVADDGSLVRPSGYAVDALGEYVASSLRGFLGTVGGGYRALAVPDGREGDGRTWRIFLESGQAVGADSWPAHRRHSSADLLGHRRLERTAAEGGTSRRRRRFQEQRQNRAVPVPGVVWSRSSAPSRQRQRQRRTRWDEPPSPAVATPPPPPRCSSCDGGEERDDIDMVMTCCGAVLCRGCAEVNPCGCPEWQNRRGFAVRIPTDYHDVDVDGDCFVEGAVMLQRPRWHQFMAMRIGMDVFYGFYSVEDVYHSSSGVTYQIHRNEGISH